MVRRVIDIGSSEAEKTGRRELIRSAAIVGFFLGMLVLAIVAQVRIADEPAATARPGQAPVAAQSHAVATAPSARPSAQPNAKPTAPAGPAQPPRQPTEPTEPAAPATREHTVTPGETLAGIALRYQVPFERIAADNGITDPNRIKAGQHLVLAPVEAGVEVVAPGATLSGYAQQFHRSVAELMALNPRLGDPDRIVAGAGLRVTAK